MDKTTTARARAVLATIAESVKNAGPQTVAIHLGIDEARSLAALTATEPKAGGELPNGALNDEDARRYIRAWTPDHVMDYVARLEARATPPQQPTAEPGVEPTVTILASEFSRIMTENAAALRQQPAEQEKKDG